jgi:hypothetical protein
VVSLFKVLVKHDEDDDCQGHCWWHEVDEVGDGYIRCFECGHLYLTARDLRREYRKGYWEVLRSGSVPRPFTPVRLWHVLTIRAKKIHFCQLCIHDF